MERRVKEHELEQDKRRQEEYVRGQRERNKLLEEIALKEEKRRLLLMQLHKEEQEIEAGRR